MAKRHKGEKSLIMRIVVLAVAAAMILGLIIGTVAGQFY